MGSSRTVAFVCLAERVAGEAPRYRAEALRVGSWSYPGVEGGLTVTPGLISELASNFALGVKGWEVPLNRDHDDERPCGWVRALEVGNGGESLYALFEVTDPETRRLVDEGSLKYVSSEIALGWFDPEDRSEKRVFEGLALTNRPYIKRMEGVSVALCEVGAAAPPGGTPVARTPETGVPLLGVAVSGVALAPTGGTPVQLGGRGAGVALSAPFDESEHPRGGDGRFGPKGGDGESSPYLRNSQGGIDFGQVPREVEAASGGRFPALPIRVKEGRSGKEGWGPAHHDAERIARFRAAGFDTPEAFYEHVFGEPDAIGEQPNGRLLVLRRTGLDHVAVAELQAEDGEYTATTGIPGVTERYLRNALGGKMEWLWSRAALRELATATSRAVHLADPPPVAGGAEACQAGPAHHSPIRIIAASALETKGSATQTGVASTGVEPVPLEPTGGTPEGRGAEVGLSAPFDESEHPRGGDGKFGPKGGDGEGSQENRVPNTEPLERSLGMQPGKVFADYLALWRNHPDQFADWREVKGHVEKVLPGWTHILDGNEPDHKLIVRRGADRDMAAIVELELRGGKYRVRSAYRLEDGRLEAKIEKERQRQVGRSALPARRERNLSEPPAHSISGPLHPPCDGLQLPFEFIVAQNPGIDDELGALVGEWTWSGAADGENGGGVVDGCGAGPALEGMAEETAIQLGELQARLAEETRRNDALSAQLSQLQAQRRMDSVRTRLGRFVKAGKLGAPAYKKAVALCERLTRVRLEEPPAVAEDPDRMDVVDEILEVLDAVPSNIPIDGSPQLGEDDVPGLDPAGALAAPEDRLDQLARQIQMAEKVPYRKALVLAERRIQEGEPR